MGIGHRNAARTMARAGVVALAALSLLATPLAAEQHNPQISAGKIRQGAPKGQVIVPRGPIGIPKGTVIIPKGNPQVVIPRGPVGIPRGPAVGFRGPIGVIPFHGHSANFIRGPHRFFRGGRYIPFVAIGTLAAIAIGSRYYSPYAYVDSLDADACMGPTDDGACELRMTEVPLEDGTSAMQCVAYCPQ